MAKRFYYCWNWPAGYSRWAWKKFNYQSAIYHCWYQPDTIRTSISHSRRKTEKLRRTKGAIMPSFRWLISPGQLWFLQVITTKSQLQTSIFRVTQNHLKLSFRGLISLEKFHETIKSSSAAPQNKSQVCRGELSNDKSSMSVRLRKCVKIIISLLFPSFFSSPKCSP